MSAYFESSPTLQYLYVTNTNSNLSLTGDFTIEFFVKANMDTITTRFPNILCRNDAYTSSTNYLIGINRTGSPNVISVGQFSLNYTIVGTTNVNNNLWHHVAVVRNGTDTNNVSLYIDGVIDGQMTNNSTWDYNSPGNGLLIIHMDTASNPDDEKFTGYLSNFRIVKGTALYTTTFTPPTTTLLKISGTSLLLFTDPNNLFADGSSNNFTVTQFGPPTASGDTPVTHVVCFKEDSKIMCLVNGEEKEMFVQDMRPGVLVKTFLHGYVPLHMIGTSKIWNPGNSDRFSDRLYLLSKDKYPELTEDLVITGAHSILVDGFTSDQFKKTFEKFNKLYVTDDKYRLMAEFDERAVPYEVEGEFNIYHFALENANYFHNYGVYANGLLVESCSKRYLQEKSNMRIL